MENFAESDQAILEYCLTEKNEIKFDKDNDNVISPSHEDFNLDLLLATFRNAPCKNIKSIVFDPWQGNWIQNWLATFNQIYESLDAHSIRFELNCTSEDHYIPVEDSNNQFSPKVRSECRQLFFGGVDLFEILPLVKDFQILE